MVFHGSDVGLSVGPGLEIGGPLHRISPAFQCVPDESDFAGRLHRGLDDHGRIRASHEVSRCAGGDLGDDGARRVAVVGAPDVVGVHRGPVARDGHEVGVGARGEVRRHTPAAVVFIEVIVDALHELLPGGRVGEVTQERVVFHVPTQRVLRGDGRAALVGPHAISSLGPGRDRGAAARREVVGSALAIAELESGSHAPEGTGGVGRLGEGVGAVHRKSVAHPAENGRVPRDRGRRLAVLPGGLVEVHVVAQQVTQGHRIGVVVMGAAALLMGIARVEGGTFIHIGFPVPVAVAHACLAGTRPDETVARIEHGHTIDEAADHPEAGQGLGRGHGGVARDPVEGLPVGGQIGEGAVEPRPHGVQGQPGGADVYPVGVRGQFLNAGVGGLGLCLGSVAPSGDGGARLERGVVEVNSGVASGVSGDPGIDPGIGGQR